MVTGWKTATVKETSTIFGRIGFRGYTKEDIVDAYEGAISLSPSNLKDGKVDITNSTFISWNKYNESPEIKLQDGDVVLVKTGSTYGKSAYVDNLKWATTLNPQIVVFKNVKINKKLFAYFVQTPEFQKQIEATIVGGAIPTLSQNQVYQFEITFPIDVGEQQRIAEALSDVDSMISSLEKLIAKKKAVKQGAMQELLTGKKRLPGFTGDWKNVSLGEIGTITGSGVDKKILPDEQPITLLNYTNVYHQITIARQDLNHQVTASYEKIKNCSVMKGDVFLTPTSETPEDIALSAVALEDMEDVVYSYHVVRLRPKLNHNGAFINYALSTPMFREQAVQFAEGSGIRYVITLKKFKEMQVYLPIGKAEQDGIVSILSDMDNEIEALEQKFKKARQIKQGMMQQLLTGKIRLV